MKRRALFEIGFIASAFVAASLLARTATASNCAGTSTGMVPLTDLTGGAYMGYEGGLYPGASNERPASHEAAGVMLATSAVRPRDAAGNESDAGKIGLVSIGMSNTTMEFQAFMGVAGPDAEKSPAVVLVDGAQGGQDAPRWIDPNAATWATMEERVAKAGLTAAQIQVAWIKQAIAGGGGAFPNDAIALRDDLKTIVQILKQKYPNVQLAYLSSRTYAGYSSTSLNPEPFAYETGFGVKELIKAQLDGDASLAYGGASAQAPWLSWGAYLWTDGLGADNAKGGTPGRSDGLEWECSDTVDDGTHPSDSGRAKVAGLLSAFFKSDTTTTPWYLAAGVTSTGSGTASGSSTATTSGAGGAGGGPTAGPGGAAANNAPSESSPEDASGCGCRVASPATSGALTPLALLAAFVLRRRRRTEAVPK